MNNIVFDIEFTIEQNAASNTIDVLPDLRYTIQNSYTQSNNAIILSEDEFAALQNNDIEIILRLLPDYLSNDEIYGSIVFDNENSFQQYDDIYQIDKEHFLENDIIDSIHNMIQDTTIDNVSRELPYYQASTTCGATGYATAPVSYTYYYYAGVNYYYYYCCPSGGSVSGSSCYYYYGATPVTYGQYECRAGGSLQADGVTCLRNNC